MSTLLDIAPTFIGLRGGVCNGLDRGSTLSDGKLSEVKELLFNYNSNVGSKDCADEPRVFGLHM